MDEDWRSGDKPDGLYVSIGLYPLIRVIQKVRELWLGLWIRLFRD